MKKEDMIAKSLLNNAYHKALGEVFKAKDGDKKMIFGKPFEMKGGKWVPSSGGGKKKEGTPMRKKSTVSTSSIEHHMKSIPDKDIQSMADAAQAYAKKQPGVTGKEREKIRAEHFKKLVLDHVKSKS